MKSMSELFSEVKRLQSEYQALRRDVNERLLRKPVVVELDGEQKIATIFAIDMSLWETKVSVYFDRLHDPDAPGLPWVYTLDEIMEWNKHL